MNNALTTLEGKLPANPMTVLQQWLSHALSHHGSNNPNKMVIASLQKLRGQLRPNARVVLCKSMDDTAGFLTFYTNYQSDKGMELTESPVASAVFHWDELGLQARVQGPITPSPEAESDAYFASRDKASQLGAWASQQSRPIHSRDELLSQFKEVEQRFAAVEAAPRPPHWGGYRLWADTVELWVNGEHRLHDRAQWVRELKPNKSGFYDGGPWSHQRLQP